MKLTERLALSALHKCDPERAHGLSLIALRLGVTPTPGPLTTPRLATTVAGLTLPNPVGLAAGYDKNAQALPALMASGFGWLEVGAATPLPQPGNPKPRLFRLTQDRAAINRFGFNNQGMDEIGQRLAARPRGIPVGLNLGANKTSDDRAGDFARVLARCGPYADFATVNVSSPNTEQLRDLQGAAALTALLAGVMDVCQELQTPIPIFLKIAPDLSPDELAQIAEVAVASGLSGIIATNTTLSRDGLHSPHKGEMGGLSGAPLFEKSTRILAQLSKLTKGELPLIGVGGISTAAQAYSKIRAGASAVQIYTAMVYHGISLATDIAQGLDQLLLQDGYDTLAQAVGTDRDAWL
jgi:dihydroorotate dehydrogenase